MRFLNRKLPSLELYAEKNLFFCSNAKESRPSIFARVVSGALCTQGNLWPPLESIIDTVHTPNTDRPVVT